MRGVWHDHVLYRGALVLSLKAPCGRTLAGGALAAVGDLGLVNEGKNPVRSEHKRFRRRAAWRGTHVTRERADHNKPHKVALEAP